jgi:hypothetical protein
MEVASTGSDTPSIIDETDAAIEANGIKSTILTYVAFYSGGKKCGTNKAPLHLVSGKSLVSFLLPFGPCI